MHITSAIPAKPGDIVNAFEYILSFHIVENRFGVFRWQRDFDGSNEGELAQYKLEFSSPHTTFMGIKLPRKSRIILALAQDAFGQNPFLYLTWRIDYLHSRDFCEHIVRETESEIVSELAELSNKKLRDIRGNDAGMVADQQQS